MCCTVALEDACVIVVWGAALCLAVLAAVSEAEGGKVRDRQHIAARLMTTSRNGFPFQAHTVAALGFFLLFIAYSTRALAVRLTNFSSPTTIPFLVWLVSFCMYSVTRNVFMFRLRSCAAAVVTIAIAFFFYVAQSGSQSHKRSSKMTRPSHFSSALPFNPYASIPEWIGTVIILCGRSFLTPLVSSLFVTAITACSTYRSRAILTATAHALLLTWV